MFSKLRRVGTTSCKVQISIELKWLTILESKDYRSGLYIDFERGSKTVSSTSRDIPAEPVDSKLVVHFEETLTLVMTLYKESGGKYLEKKGKLVLKGLSKVTNTVVKLGSVNLSLHTLADDYEKKNMILQLGDSKGRTMGTINLASTSKYLGDAADGDDDSSVMSGASRGTFASASHMDILQALSASSGTQPVGVYRREKASEFSENDTKLCTSMRTDPTRYQGHENFKSPVPSKSTFASNLSEDVTAANIIRAKLASAPYDENSASIPIKTTPQVDKKETSNPFGGYEDKNVTVPKKKEISNPTVAYEDKNISVPKKIEISNPIVENKNILVLNKKEISNPIVAYEDKNISVSNKKDISNPIVAYEDKSVPLPKKKEQSNPFRGNGENSIPVTNKKSFEANEMYETDNTFNPSPHLQTPQLHDVLDAKDLEILSLKKQLNDAKSYQNAMEDEFQTKITSMIERIIEIEDESDLEHYNHEQQTIKLLKAAGIYEKSGYDFRDSDNNLTYSDAWGDLFREQTDEERIKVMALKKCLIQFSNQLTEEENCELLDAGVVLGAAKNKAQK